MEIKKLLIIYFSGTGNTEYICRVMEKHFVNAGAECRALSIEKEPIINESNFIPDSIMVAFPIYGGLMPRIMRTFINKNYKLFENKTVISVSTQYMFSGDGGGLLYRMLKGKISIKNYYSVHFNMPNNISDSKVFSIKNGNELKKMIEKAELKAAKVCKRIINCKSVKNGRHIFSQALGFSQRYFFRKNESEHFKQLTIDSRLCTKCGKCVKCCPVNNLIKNEIKIATLNKCTLCYRCVNLCPQKAIKLVSKNYPEKQYKGIRKEE